MAGFKDLYDLYNADLIITLISKIKEKIDKGNLDSDKTLGELALEVKPTLDWDLDWIDPHTITAPINQNMPADGLEQERNIEPLKDSLDRKSVV